MAWIGKLLALSAMPIVLFGSVATLGLHGPAQSADSGPHTPKRAGIFEEDASPANDSRPRSTADGIDDLIEQLDSPRYSIRAATKARIESLLARPETIGPTIAACRAALHREDLSFEARRQLTQWTASTADASGSTTESEPKQEDLIVLSQNDLHREISALTSDSFARRQAAKIRLSAAWRAPSACVAAIAILGERLDSNIQDAADLMELRASFAAAVAQWLLAAPAPELTWTVGDERIERWLMHITAGAGSSDPLAQQRAMAAHAQLQLALADERSRGRTTAALQRKLDGPLPPEARRVVAQLIELTHPAMVAEYWANGRHQGEQHLLVGVPSQAPGAARPSHFDRIDDQWAHCVSGNTLSPGLYPSNVAVPHPMSEEAFFHLINLPTPRDRLAYAHRVRQDDSLRLKQISRRTVDRLLTPPRPLTEAETIMLAQLDPGEVARFSGEYFSRVEDGPFSDHLGPLRLGGRPSRFGLLCAVMAERPDRRAAPGLLKAIERRRFAPPTSACPYRMEYLAALVIARGDAWEAAEQWLAAQTAETINLVEDQRQDPPELGATAAALLVRRRQASLEGMGLYPVADPVLSALEIEGYRFARADDRRQFDVWWKSQKVAP